MKTQKYAVDKVPIKERKELMRKGYYDRKGTKYDWLRNPANMRHGDRMAFKALRESSLRTARAWAIRQLTGHVAMALHQQNPG